MNNYPDLVGFHAGELSEYVNIPEMQKLSNVLQFHVNKRELWDFPLIGEPAPGHGQGAQHSLAMILKFVAVAHIRPVIHCPFKVRMIVDDELWHLTEKYIVQLYTQIKAFDPELRIPFVLHPGKPDPTTSLECSHAATVFENNLRSLLHTLNQFRLDNACIAIETDANHYTPCTRFKGIRNIIEKYDDPRIGLCLDTEHSYASGEQPMIADTSSVMVLHLNTIAKKIKFGGGKDWHREALETGKELEWLELVACEAKSRNIPIILERYDMGVVRADINYINRIFANESN